MRSAGASLFGSAGRALPSFAARSTLPSVAALGEHDDPRRLRAEEDARVGRVARDLDDLEASVVEHLAELVQRVQADGVVDLLGAAVLEHDGALHAEAAREEVDVHLIHADAPVALEPDQARLARGDVVPIGEVEQEHPALAEGAAD